MGDMQENFRKFLLKWKADNWKKNQTALADYLGISRQQLSNILNSHRGGSEETRINICKKLGVDYRTLIQIDLGKDNSSATDKDLDIAPRQPIDLRLEAMKTNLLEIYKSGNSPLISATETNLASFRAMIQMEKRARKKEALSLAEEGESLLNLPMSKEKSGRNS